MLVISYSHQGRRLVELRSEVPKALVSEDAARGWIHCARVGEWKGHPSGPFEFTRAVFKRIIANFKAEKEPVVLTYEHPRYAGDGNPVIAAGWIHDLDLRGDDLYAQVEFTKRAAGYIREGEYRFCSVVVDFESVHRQSAEDIGPELFEIGLTNQPFLSGLRPIQLSRGAASETNRSLSMKDMDLLKVALEELGKDASMDDVIKFVEGKRLEMEALEGEKPEPVEAAEEPEEGEEAEEVEAADKGKDAKADKGEKLKPKDELAASEEPAADAVAASDEQLTEEVALEDDGPRMEMLKALGTMLEEASGMDLAGITAAIEQAPEKVKQLFGEPEGPPSGDAAAAGLSAARARVTALSKQLTETKDQHKAEVAKLSSRLAELEDDAIQREVDEAIKAGNILKDARDKMVKLGRMDRDMMREFLGEAASKPDVPTTKIYAEKKPSDVPPIARKFSRKQIDDRMTLISGFHRHLSRAALEQKAIEQLAEQAQNKTDDASA